MRVTWIHPSLVDCANFIVGKVSRRKTSPLGPETLKFLVLVRRHEVSGDLAVARHWHRALLREHAITTEIARKLGGGDSFGLGHGDLNKDGVGIVLYANRVKYAIYAKCVQPMQ